MKQLLIKTMKTCLGTLEHMSTGLKYKPQELVVVCMHSTPADRLSDFEQLVKKLLRVFKPFSPDDVAQYFAHKDSFQSGPYILFTFDDGLKNNLHSAEVLKQLGVKALYFLVPDFIAASDGEQYYRTYIRPVVDVHIDHEKEDVTPMGLPDLQKLVDLGHSVGFHTKSHRLSGNMTTTEIATELRDVNGVLHQFESHTKHHFASPNNTSISVNSACKEEIAKQFVLHYTTFPGLNAKDGAAQLILRRNIEVHWSWGEVAFAIGQWDLGRWKDRLARYRQI